MSGIRRADITRMRWLAEHDDVIPLCAERAIMATIARIVPDGERRTAMDEVRDAMAQSTTRTDPQTGGRSRGVRA